MRVRKSWLGKTELETGDDILMRTRLSGGGPSPGHENKT
jgi:hypothetical protein